MTSASSKSLVGLLYELMSIVAMGGQRHLMLCSAAWRLRALNAFVASASSALSSNSKGDLVA